MRHRAMGKSQSNSGFSFIELIVSVAVLTLVVLAIAQLNAHLMKQTGQMTSLSQIDVYRQNIIVVTLNEASWTQTLIENSAGGASPLGKMDCLKNVTPCTDDGTPTGLPIQNQPFALYDASNALFFDAIKPSAGVTRQGVSCSAYSSQGSADCPFRFNLVWSAICTGSCVNPLVKVSAPLVYSEGLKERLTINTGAHSVADVFRNAQ